ncbi:TetR/AcrR family transcriptional regulator [Saccharopolyspora sp. WRP15-2]|uniref:TetR/AcrR family transcriptional regulator n=2 Tax=Saccharopolyspora oryzae TaxID=2997343 RepID=A0ABT4UUT5_9PSEU|nr:TetR/AcrR family transcriptional regulator [Saccharopolyspora oryzae]
MNAEPGEQVPPAGQSRQTRKREQRRDHVFRAAIELFVDRGYDSTTMDDIAERADVARATVFNHYPRKAAFLEEWTLRRRERAARVLAESVSGTANAKEQLRTFFAELVATNEESRAEAMALLLPGLRATNLIVDPALGHALADVIGNSADAGKLRPGADPEHVGRLLAVGYFSVLYRWISHDPPSFDFWHEIEILLDTVFDGALHS